ncbi:22069_t:CDS:2 [Cetraspora pellucida]|uniref:22069_t:CDS:1 n=1 Tax=Cetraspora pellucida TaxID=1433469 RepID=A0A9N9E7P5_9GLOM|nr:22069_t:CDS:2 [Cetraspora pellucida]
MSNSKAHSEFVSYIQNYNSHIKSDNNSYKIGKQRSPKSKCTTPEPIIDYERQVDRKQFQQSHSSKYLHPDQPLTHSSRNMRTSPEPRIKNEIRCCKCSQTGHFTSECPQHNKQSQSNNQFSQPQHPLQNFSISTPQESQHYQQFQQSQQPYPLTYLHDQLMQNYSKNTPSTPRNHQNQSHSLKNKRTKSEQNINQTYQKSQFNQQFQQSQQPFFNKSKNKCTTSVPSTKSDNRNYKWDFKKDRQQFKDRSHQKPHQSQQIEPSQTVIVNIVQSQKAPKQEQARENLFSRLLKKKSDLTKEK